MGMVPVTPHCTPSVFSVGLLRLRASGTLSDGPCCHRLHTLMITGLIWDKKCGRSFRLRPLCWVNTGLVYDNFVCLSVVDEVDGGVGGRALGGAFVADDVHRAAVAEADGEVLPLGGYARVEYQFVAPFVDADDVFDTGFVSPGGGAGVPGPATAAGMLRVAVDVGSDAVGLDFVFEHIGQCLGAVDGVDEGVEEIGHVVASFLQLGHDVPHGAMGVLATVLAYTDRIVHDVAGRGL